MTTVFRCKNISTVFIRHFALALSRAESTLLRADAPLFRRDREHRWPTRRTEATRLLHPGRDVAVQSMWSAIEIFCSRVVSRQRFFRKNNEMADEYDANAGGNRGSLLTVILANVLWTLRLQELVKQRVFWNVYASVFSRLSVSESMSNSTCHFKLRN